MIEIDTMIFDIDGTLVDASEGIIEAVNFTLRELGLKAKKGKEIMSYVGTGAKDLMRRTLGPTNAEYLDKAFEIFGKYYVDVAAAKAVLYPEVKETLEYFGKKRKIILSNRKAKFAEKTLEKIGIRQYFDAVIGAEDEECLKPSACPLFKHPVSSKIEKEKSIMIGDMDIDILTGRDAGIKTCWVTYGLGKKEDVMRLKPDYIINKFSELKNIIK